MKNLFQYILEFKERVKTTFDYESIKEQIQNCKPTFFGKCVTIEALWKPQIYFVYDKGWSAGKPNKEFHNGKDYKEISLGESCVMYIDFYAEKKMFKANVLEGKVLFCYNGYDFNDDENKNWEEVLKYIKSKFNAKVEKNKAYDEFEYISFKTYEELEEILEGLENVINKYNTNYEKNNAAYLYFDKSEATQNAEDKKKQYEILTYEEEIVKLNKELEDIKRAATASDTDLTALMDIINDKIKYFKDKKESIK